VFIAVDTIGDKKMKALKILLTLTLIGIISSSLLAQQAQNPRTYANPLNLSYMFVDDADDTRDAADPDVVIFNNEYYMFATRSGGYWTSPNLRDWTLIIPTGLDVESYAPGVIAMRDSLFYIPTNNGQIYKTADPKSGVWIPGPTVNAYGDPAFFLDDDDKLYMYYGLSNSDPTGVVELDPITFQEIGPRVNIVYSDTVNRGWERRGDDNLFEGSPWIEGSWMTKKDGTYYLHYSAPGTEWKTYADGIYVSDSPTGPFTYADYSPYSFKPTGFIAGAGHGSTFKDMDGNYWRVFNMVISVNHIFERRIGMLPVGFDEDGQIFCNTSFGDYPQFFPGEVNNPAQNNLTGMMLLSHKKHVTASSSLENHGPNYAVDEEVRTYWSAQTGNADEWLMIDLGKESDIEAIQVNFAEVETTPVLVRGRNVSVYHQYILEVSNDGMAWNTLIDKSSNTLDVAHDYIELSSTVQARYLKLKNVYTPGNGKFAVRGLRVFGNSEKVVFTDVTDFTVNRNPADRRDAVVSWQSVENADGYVVRYGIAPDKLYNNYMVYDTNSVSMHSLNADVEYYFSVQAFDSGTDYYTPIGEIRTFKSGNWDDVDTWQKFDGNEWVHPAPDVPAVADEWITISSGHTVTITASDSADQVIVEPDAIMIINPGVTFTVKDGIGTDLLIQGTLDNLGIVEVDPSATVSFVNGGVYIHNQNGGSIPTAEWRTGSTGELSHITSTVPFNSNQNFYNLVWDSDNQDGDLNLNWDGNTIGGTISIVSTGSGILYMCAPDSGASVTVSIEGDVIQSGGQFAANGVMNENTAVTINQKGNITVTGGNFSITRGPEAGSGVTVWNLKGNVSLQNATTQNINPDGAKFVLGNSEVAQSLLFTNVTYGAGGFPLEVDSGSALDMGTSVFEGGGSFTLKSGATLTTAHVQGINGSIATTGLKTFYENANFHFNGSVAQITGDFLPDSVNDLIINNDESVTLSKSTVVNGIMRMKNGAFSAGSNTFAYGPNASLEYSGESAQTTTSSEYPPDVKPINLIIANTRGVTLHESRSAGYIELFGRLHLGANTITADSASQGTATIFINTNDGGILRLADVVSSQKLYPVGTILYSPVWITNHGSADTVGVGAIRETDSAPYGGRVRIIWNIEAAGEGDGDYTLQFGWINTLEDNEFSANRVRNARIFNLSTMTEAGAGDYEMQFETLPYTLSRSGITELGTFSVGAFGPITGVDTDDAIPLTFSLEQNYPNPFNPSTTIHYSLANDSKVSIIVYDILGRKVTTLVDDYSKAGNYTVEWNPNVASGIYLYRMVTNDFIQTRKMMLLK
jgi:xylan 1,4-beta-xylosidase